MTEPLLLARQQTAPGESLWEKAPGWRNLVTAASLFTVLALVTPVLMPPPADAPPHIIARHRPLSVATTTRSVATTTRPLVHSSASVAPVLPARALRTASLPPAPAPAEQAPSAPQAQAAPQSSACLLVMPPAPAGFGMGTVVGFEDRATSLARIKLTEANTGGPIDPAYIDNQRVTVRLMNGNYRVLLVPTTMQVQVGDRIRFQGGFRNMSLPCNYVPNLITADLGPASPPAMGAQAPSPP